MPFKLKIALLTMLVAGLVLAGFGVFFLATIHRVNLDRIDRQLQAFAAGPLYGQHPPGHWRHFERSLGYLQGDGAPPQAVQVRERGGRVVFTTAGCPPEIAGLALPERSGTAPPSPPPPPPEEGFVVRLDRDGDGLVSPAEFDGPPEHFPELDRDGDGYLSGAEAARFHGVTPPGLPAPGDPRRAPQHRSVSTATGDWRVAILGNETHLMLVATDLADFRADAQRFQVAFLIALPVALLLLGVLGWILAARTLRPVGVITRTVESITARGLRTRVPPTAADPELAHLVRVLDEMLDRLDRSFQQASRFSADAAHQLQTPLTVLQGELERAVQEAPDGSPEQQRCSTLLEEVQQLKTLVQKLLLLARADAGKLPLELEAVDLGELLATAREDLEVLAPDRQIETDLQAGVVVRGDRELLEQVVRNLITNAVQYGERGGTVRLQLHADTTGARCSVTNTGSPVPEAEREQVFARFHRGAAGSPGLGLGLSLAREIARAHGGELRLEPDSGDRVTFTLELPASR